MVNRLDLRGKLDGSPADRAGYLRANLPRPVMVDDPPIVRVQQIIQDVRRNGDAGLRQATKEAIGIDLGSIQVPPVEVEGALRSISPQVREALEEAHDSILAYHRATKPEDVRVERDGLTIRQSWRAVERVGIHVPGGDQQLPSTVLMTAVPARVAGVDKLALCVAPGVDGKVPLVTLAAAGLAQVDEVYAIGGVEAIAAMTYGTETVRPVDLIVGSGGVEVAIAKQQVSGVVGVPSSFTGPSEVVVVADQTTPVEYAAIDIVVQAEHGPDGMAWLITWSAAAADAIEESIAVMATRSPRREAVEATLGAGGFIVLVDNAQAAIEVANVIAPEQLQLMSVDPESLVPLVRNAGAIFSGTHSPASVGDYLAGPSHVLPVHGAARFAGGLGVHQFLRDQHVISLDEHALARVAPHVSALAEAEELDAHSRSVKMRLRP